MFGSALLWLGGILTIGLLALPLTTYLLTPLESRGAGFAFVIGTAVTTLVVFWTGQVAFNSATILLGVGVLVALSALALRAGVQPPWRHFAEVSGVLVLAFALAVALRLDSPQLEIWAEGYLNFGLVKTLFRTSALPPEDFWFAGAPVRYYYGGHLAAVIWAALTDTPARFVPNLAVPTFYAMLVAGAYDLGSSLGVARGVRRRFAGVLTALLVGIGGNLYEPLRVLFVGLPAGLTRTVRRTFDITTETLGGPFSTFEATHFASFPTDVPLYSVLIGSLHAHVMSQPYTLLVGALLLAYYRTPAEHHRHRLGRLAAVGPVVGLLLLTNVWSVPTGLGLVALAVAFAPAHLWGLLPDRIDRLEVATIIGTDHDTHTDLDEPSRYIGGLVASALVAVLALASIAPFVFGTNTTRPIGLFPSRTSSGVYLVEYGAFLGAFGLFLVPRLREHLSLRVMGLVVGGLAVLAVLLDVAALAFVVPVLLGAWWLLRRSDSVGFETVLILAGAGLALIVEVAYVRGGAAMGRYNTIYKVHSQVWLLWTLAAGTALASILGTGRSAWRSRAEGALTAETARATIAIILVVSMSVYGGLAIHSAATEDHSITETTTLDATAFVAVTHPDHDAAIEWLDARAGQPHIVAAAPTERAMFSFRASPASSLTGLPTVAGWTHAADYHSEAAYDRRVRDVRAIYEGSPATRARLLDRYDIQYIYAGPYERQRYQIGALSAQPGLHPRQFGNVTVYVVDQSALSASTNSES